MHFYRVCASEVESVEDHKPTKHRTEAISSLSFFFLSLFFFYYIQFLVLLPVLIAVWAGHHLQLFQRELRHSQTSKEMPSLQLYPAVSSRKTFFGVLFLFVLQNHFSMPRNIWFNKKKGKKSADSSLEKKPNLKVSGEWGDANLTVQILKGD